MTRALSHPHNWATEAPVNIYDVFENFFNTPFQISSQNKGFKVDVSETDAGYLIEADLPGLTKDDIDIRLEDEKLTISVEHEESEETKEKNYIHRERRHVSMVRGCYLKDADAGNVSAKLENGVLTIEVPKVAPENNIHKIEIG